MPKIQVRSPTLPLTGANPLQSLVLCGGLSNSPWITHRVKEFVRDELNGSMTVIIPENVTAAIARGAAIHARSQKIVMCRRSRDSLGIVGYKSYKEDVHDEDDRLVLASGKEVVRNGVSFAFKRV